MNQETTPATDDISQPAVSAMPDGKRTAHAYQHLLEAARELLDRIHQREEEIRRLLRVTENINRGLGMEEILEFLFREMRPFIPYNRIGCALIDEKHELVVAHWAQSDRPILLSTGFRAPLAGSTLAEVATTGRPRILNDLGDYLEKKPLSRSTQLIVREGMRSSLTCPLVVQCRPVGFLFFSSDQPGTYSDAHVEFFQQIAGQLSTIVEKGRLYSELAEKAAMIESQNRKLLDQMELARQFQRAMIPAASLRLPDLALAFTYEPASSVGGDILDVIPLARRRAVVFVGDAMGSGVEAAMMMAAAKTALLTAIQSDCDPAALLGRVNEELYRMLAGERFITAACACLDPSAGHADVAIAGHLNPIHLAGGTGAVSHPGDGGVPLGVRSGVSFPAHRCRFERSDALVFFTDGVVEARNSHHELYGGERLTDLVRRHAAESPAEMLQALLIDLEHFCGQAGRHDDLTALIVRSEPGEQTT